MLSRSRALILLTSWGTLLGFYWFLLGYPFFVRGIFLTWASCGPLPPCLKCCCKGGHKSHSRPQLIWQIHADCYRLSQTVTMLSMLRGFGTREVASRAAGPAEPCWNTTWCRSQHLQPLRGSARNFGRKPQKRQRCLRSETKRHKTHQNATSIYKHLRAFTSGLCSTEGHTPQARVSTCKIMQARVWRMSNYEQLRAIMSIEYHWALFFFLTYTRTRLVWTKRPLGSCNSRRSTVLLGSRSEHSRHRDVGRWLNRRANSVPTFDQNPLQRRQRSENHREWKMPFFLNLFWTLFTFCKGQGVGSNCTVYT